MRLKLKPFLLVCFLLAAMLLISGCSSDLEKYREYDAEGYNISIQYNANGGAFTDDNVEVMADFFNPNELKADANGNYQIPLLAPENEQRKEHFTPSLSGHFLVGWYAERTETPNGYTYSKKWDFEKDRLSISASGDYSATDPVLTLYAVWAPNISVEIYDAETEELMQTIQFNPTMVDDFKKLQLPEWDTKKGTIKMHSFPAKEGYTYNTAYYDKECTQPITTETIVHNYSIDEANGTVNNPVTKVYVEYLEGQWFRVYNAKSFRDNLSLSANYMIMNDLDFKGEVWPSALINGNYTGTIQGNGYTIRNVSAVQSANNKMRNGLFGELTDESKITDIHFENVTLTIKGGTRLEGAYFGLFAGYISDNATISNVTVQNGVIQLGSKMYYTADSNYVIGLVCASGNYGAIDGSDITCVGPEDAPNMFDITIEGNQVIISKKEI